jgi:hypothetical protein
VEAERERNPLWLILVETVHRLPLYPSHKAYLRDTLLLDSPEITVEEISRRLNIPLGEVMVILQELREEGYNSSA